MSLDEIKEKLESIDYDYINKGDIVEHDKLDELTQILNNSNPEHLVFIILKLNRSLYSYKKEIKLFLEKTKRKV